MRLLAVGFESKTGVVPAAMGRDVFDIEKLKPGMVVAMNADVKADLSKPEDFKS